MKKLLPIILCIATIFSLSGCMTKQQRNLKKQYEKEAVPIAVKYIEENMVFATDTDDSLKHHSGQEFGEYVYTNVLGTKLGIHRFYLVKNKKLNLKDAF